MKRTPIALAAVLLAAWCSDLSAQSTLSAEMQYQNYLSACRFALKHKMVQDNTALEKVDYYMYLKQQDLKRKFPDPVDPDKDADGCLTYAAWLKQHPTVGKVKTSGTKAVKKVSATTKKDPSTTTTTTQTTQTTPDPNQTTTPVQNQQVGGGTTQTTGVGTTDATMTPVQSMYGGSLTVDPNLSGNKSVQDAQNLNQEGGSKNQPTIDGSAGTTGVVNAGTTSDGKDGKKGKDGKGLFSGKSDKKSDLKTSAPSPDGATTGGEHKRTFWDKLLGRNKEPIGKGPLTAQPGAEKGKDLANMVGGGKFALYSGLLAAMFLTGPGAIAGIFLFATIGFFAGYWVTKKNG